MASLVSDVGIGIKKLTKKKLFLGYVLEQKL